jgi:hypothetical protein
MDAFPLLRLCERVLLRPVRLGEEPIRWRPLSSRCLPLSFGRSIRIASLECCSSTTIESIDSGSSVEAMVLTQPMPARELRSSGEGRSSGVDNETNGSARGWDDDDDDVLVLSRRKSEKQRAEGGPGGWERGF